MVGVTSPEREVCCGWRALLVLCSTASLKRLRSGLGATWVLDLVVVPRDAALVAAVVEVTVVGDGDGYG